MNLIGARHALLVIVRAIESEASDLEGFRPTFSREFGPDVGARRDIRHRWMASEPLIHSDPVLRLTARGAGRPRTIRHLGDIPDEAWRGSPVRRLLAQLGVEDRLSAILPVSDAIEVVYILDRPDGSELFDEEEAATLLAAVRRLPLFTRRFAWRHGVMPGQRQLEDDEWRLVDELLGPKTLPDVADELEESVSDVERRAQQVMDKLAVDSRVELIQAWISEPVQHHRAGNGVGADPVRLIRRGIDECLIDGQVDVASIAEHLESTPADIRSALADTDTTFRDLKRKARFERARLLLSRPWLNLGEVSLGLGYGQVSSLHRAVKRWTDMTPLQWRTTLIDGF